VAVTTSQVLVTRAPSQGHEHAHPESRPAGDHEAAVDAADDGAPRVGPIEGQPALAPKRTPKVLVMREDGYVMSQRPAHDAEASISHTATPALDVAVAHTEQGLRRADAPPTHFNKDQAKQAFWQEFRDHDASINNVLTKALRIHRGPSIWIFQVSVFRRIRDLLPHPFCVRTFPNSAFLHVLDCW
jgi:hypothetical protein